MLMKFVICHFILLYVALIHFSCLKSLCSKISGIVFSISFCALCHILVDNCHLKYQYISMDVKTCTMTKITGWCKCVEPWFHFNTLPNFRIESLYVISELHEP
jgi:hypothetical protein